MSKDIERDMMDYEKERAAFEKHASKFFNTNEVFEVKNDQYVYDEIIFMWDCWIESAKRAKEKLKGYVVVPVEPTDAMIEAGKLANECGAWPHEIYDAMLEAARGGK